MTGGQRPSIAFIEEGLELPEPELRVHSMNHFHVFVSVGLSRKPSALIPSSPLFTIPSLAILHYTRNASQQAKKNSPSTAVDAAAKLSTLKLAPMSERASETKARKIIPPLFQFRLCLSLSLSLSRLRTRTHLLSNGIALYSRNFVRGDSFVEAGRPDGSKIEEENSGPGQRRLESRDTRGEMPALSF